MIKFPIYFRGGAVAKFGDFYHFMHHAHEIEDLMKEKYHSRVGHAREEEAFIAALEMATTERLGEMTDEEKLTAIHQGLKFTDLSSSLYVRAKDVRVTKLEVATEVRLSNVLDELLRQLFAVTIYTMNSKVYPPESA